MFKISKLALTGGIFLLTSGAMAVTPLHSVPDSSGTRPQPLPSVSRSEQNTGELQFPTTQEQIRAALQLDKSNRQLKRRSKTRDLASLQELKMGALVEFATNSTRIIPTVELDNLGKALSDLEAGIQVEIVGHTDNRGSRSYNMDLSRRRAEAVKQHLVREYGVDRYALTTRGSGEISPIASNVTSEGRQLNRRVEFVRIIE